MNVKVIAAALCLLLISSACAADDIVTLPSGRTLSTGQVRAEVLVSPANDNGNFQMLTAGFDEFELAVWRVERASQKKETLLHAQWCFLPETFFTPALSFGVRDITSESPDRIGIYTAMTKRIPVAGTENYISDFALTVGFGAKAIKGVFFGADCISPEGVRAQVEYHRDRWNTSLGVLIAPNVELRTYSIDKMRYYGIEMAPAEF